MAQLRIVIGIEEVLYEPGDLQVLAFDTNRKIDDRVAALNKQWVLFESKSLLGLEVDIAQNKPVPRIRQRKLHARAEIDAIARSRRQVTIYDIDYRV